MSPSAKIVVALTLIAASGLVLGGFLIYGSLDRARVELAEANFQFVLDQLRNSTEANVNLGIALADVEVAQDLIEEVRAADNQVVAVEIFSDSGISLFNTDRGSIGEPIRETWWEAIRHSGTGDRWALEEFGDIVVGEILRNDFGEPVGYVAITIDGAARETYAGRIASVLIRHLGVVLPAALLAVAVASGFTVRHAGTGLRRAAAHLADDAPLDGNSGPLDRLADEARAAISRKAKEIDSTTEAILSLDEDTGPHAAVPA